VTLMKPILQSSEGKRIFLRVPVRLWAKAFLYGRWALNVIIDDLSTTGISFFVKKTVEVPESFEVDFRLGPFSRNIRSRVLVRDRIAASGGFRIGCVFVELAEKNNNLINKFVSKYLNLSLPSLLVCLSAILLTVDACLRILAYTVNLYYSQTLLGKSFNVGRIPDSYLVFLLSYGFFSFLSFMLTDRLKDDDKRIRFMFGIFCLFIAFVFILNKNMDYLKTGLWRTNNSYILAFLSLEALLVIYAGFSIWMASRATIRISVASKIIKQQLESIQETPSPPAT